MIDSMESFIPETVPLCPKCSFSYELHDKVWGCPAIPNDLQAPEHSKVKTGAAYENIIGRRLTDRAINKHAANGWYGPEAREARMKRARDRFAKQSKWRTGDGGRMIYVP